MSEGSRARSNEQLPEVVQGVQALLAVEAGSSTCRFQHGTSSIDVSASRMAGRAGRLTRKGRLAWVGRRFQQLALGRFWGRPAPE